MSGAAPAKKKAVAPAREKPDGSAWRHVHGASGPTSSHAKSFHTPLELTTPWAIVPPEARAHPKEARPGADARAKATPKASGSAGAKATNSPAGARGAATPRAPAPRVSAAVKAPHVQAKMEVSQPSDPLEREADDIAEQVTRMLAGPGAGAPPEAPSRAGAGIAQTKAIAAGPAAAIQRKCGCGGGTSRASAGKCDECRDSDMVMRKADGEGASAAAGGVQDGAGGFIVDDDAATATAGQMRKSAFLAELRASLCAAGDAALARAGRDTKGCPHIEKWLATYAARPASQLERAMRKLAPAAGGVRSAREYIPLVTARVVRGINTWIETGKIPDDIPDELRAELPGAGGVVGAIAGAVSSAVSSVVGAVGGALSAIGHLFFKEGPGGARGGADRGALSARLGPGRPLDGPARGRMESAFGYSFDRVRIHDDSGAAGLSRDLNARAFTIGSHVAFAAAEYRPGSPAGDALLAHELAHVVQQGAAAPAVARADAGGPVPEGGAALEDDADVAATGAVAHLWSKDRDATGLPPASQLVRPAGGLRLQRCGPSSEKTGPTFQDCTPQNQEVISSDNKKAHDWIVVGLRDAEKASAALKAGTLRKTSADDEGKVPAAAAEVNAIVSRLKQDFRLDVTSPEAPGQLDTIVGLLRSMAGAAHLQFECHANEDTGDVGKVSTFLPYVPAFTQLADVQLFKPYFVDASDKETFRVFVIVHEFAHKYGAASDNGKLCPLVSSSGEVERATSSLDTAHAVDNADSYAAFCYHSALQTELAPSIANICSQSEEVQGRVRARLGVKPAAPGAVPRRALDDGPGALDVPVTSPGDSTERDADRMAGLALRSLPVGSAARAGLQIQLAPAAGPEPAAGGGFVVDDDAATLTAGQMRKSAFLAELRASVCFAADAALARAGRNTNGCPVIEKWLATYAGRPASQLERALRKFVPAVASARSAREYIPLVAARVVRGVNTWIETGKVPDDVPDELRDQLTGGGVAGAVAGAVSAVVGAIGGALSAIGHLFFKDGPGGARAGSDREAVAARLGPGRPLEGAARARMESAFGYGFDRVRVHDDAGAAGLSRDLNARAFTIGSHVAFGAAEYRPGTPVGDALLAHELAHVIQQGAAQAPTAPVARSPEGGSGLEEDADLAAAGALGALWGRERGVGAGAHQALRAGAAHGPIPRAHTGLRLQRCGGDSSKAAKSPEAAKATAAFDAPLPDDKQVAAEAKQRDESEERRRKNPDVYDPEYIPEVTVKLFSEEYFYDFETSSLQMPCPTSSGACTVIGWTNRVEIDKKKWIAARQTLGTVSVVSTLALAVKALTGRVTMYVPPDNPGAYNHELVQVMATYKLFRKFEALAAREIRRRLIEARRQAASHPENWKSLIGVEAIDTMVREAIDPLFAAAVEKGTDVGHAITNADVNTASAFPPDLKPPPYVKYGHGPFPKPPPASP